MLPFWFLYSLEDHLMAIGFPSKVECARLKEAPAKNSFTILLVNCNEGNIRLNH